MTLETKLDNALAWIGDHVESPEDLSRALYHYVGLSADEVYKELSEYGINHNEIIETMRKSEVPIKDD